MSAVIDEPIALEVAFAQPGEAANAGEWEKNHQDVLHCNREAIATVPEDFEAFLDLLNAADTEYIDAPDYALPDPAPAEPMLDWDAVSQALAESQQILIGVQNLLAETLAAMGVEDYAAIRVYSDTDGSLRLVSGHPRREEIESALNSPQNHDLRTLYQAAVSGMSLAGGLVGNMSVPEDVLARVRAKYSAA